MDRDTNICHSVTEKWGNFLDQNLKSGENWGKWGNLKSEDSDIIVIHNQNWIMMESIDQPHLKLFDWN